jgi:hypothetical protein
MFPPAYQHHVNWYNHIMNSQQVHFLRQIEIPNCDRAGRMAGLKFVFAGWQRGGASIGDWYYELISMDAMRYMRETTASRKHGLSAPDNGGTA